MITEDPQSIDIGNQAMSHEEAKKESKSNYSSIEWNGYEWEIQLSWIEEVEVDSDESPYECGRWGSLICFDEEAEKSFEEIMKDNESEELDNEEIIEVFGKPLGKFFDENDPDWLKLEVKYPF